MKKYYVILNTIHKPDDLEAMAWDVEPVLFESKEAAQKYIDGFTARTIIHDEWVTVKEFAPKKKRFKGWTSEQRIRPVYLSTKED